MKRIVMAAISGVAVAAMMGGCAAPGASQESSATTYVLVFTVPEGTFTTANPHCSGDCTPIGFDHDPIFLVEDVFPPAERRFTQYMYSPRWHQPDLTIARRWGRCVVEALEKAHPDFGRITVSSAYLIRVRAPVQPGTTLRGASPARDPCESVWRR